MFQTGFKLNYLILLALVGGIFSFEYQDLNNLGQRITESVNRDLAPLKDLGPRISAQVRESLRPLRSREYYDQNVNLGSRISADVQSNLPSYGNLGQQIQETVYQSLEPVRAIEVVFRMKGGVGGTTIATHLPEGKKFIIRNNQISLCSGTISDENGECSGTLSPFQVKEKQDYCYSKNGYSIVNNYICVGANTISVINNDVICESNTGTPALLLPLSEYNKLCKEISEKVEYKYIANPNDPTHVEIPNKNKYVKCTNNQSGVCTFTESHLLPSSSGNTIVINGQNNVYSNNYSD